MVGGGLRFGALHARQKSSKTGRNRGLVTTLSEPIRASDNFVGLTFPARFRRGFERLNALLFAARCLTGIDVAEGGCDDATAHAVETQYRRSRSDRVAR